MVTSVGERVGPRGFIPLGYMGENKMMIVTNHAIRRYRSRIGKSKRTSPQRIREHIKNQIENHAIYTYKVYSVDRYGAYHVVTPTFVARCQGNRVITILERKDDHYGKVQMQRGNAQSMRK